MGRVGAGRDLGKEAHWRRHVRGQARSGLSVQAYCRQERLPTHGFYWWRQELARREAESEALQRGAAPTFVPVSVATELPGRVPASRIEIVLPGDLRVRLRGAVDLAFLGEVLAVLDQRQERREQREGRTC
jgi:transposase